jgi:hypothetical protein
MVPIKPMHLLLTVPGLQDMQEGIQCHGLYTK